METAAFARIETHVYGAVLVKVERNETEKYLWGMYKFLSSTDGGSFFILGGSPRLWISRARLSELENFHTPQMCVICSSF